MIRSLLAASAVLLVALPARAARPDDAVTLEYAPSRSIVAVCPAADFLAVEVQIRLGYELIQPSAPLHLSVKIDRVNGRFQSVGEMRDDDGKITFTRTYSEIDCTQAVVSMAVSVAVRFTRAAEPPDPSPPPPPGPVEPPPPTLAETPPEPPPPAIARSPLPERRRLQVGLSSAFSLGTAPKIVGGLGGFFGARWSRVSMTLEGRALFAPSATLDRATVRDGYHFTFAAISGSGCYHPVWALVCARVEVGRLFFDNPSIDVNPAQLSILGLGLRLGGDWDVTPWLAIRAYVDVLAQPLASTIRHSAGSPIVWKQGWLSGALGIGPVFTFSAM